MRFCNTLKICRNVFFRNFQALSEYFLQFLTFLKSQNGVDYSQEYTGRISGVFQRRAIDSSAALMYLPGGVV